MRLQSASNAPVPVSEGWATQNGSGNVDGLGVLQRGEERVDARRLTQCTAYRLFLEQSREIGERPDMLSRCVLGRHEQHQQMYRLAVFGREVDPLGAHRTGG